MRIGIDLLWVRPGKCGGTESYIRNLLDGFGVYGQNREYMLFVAKDNADSFRSYEKYGNMSLEICNVVCADQMKRILWENIRLNALARKKGVECMFIPVYSKPVAFGASIPYVTVIHDLQGFHYPEYFSAGRKAFFHFMWWHACKTSRFVVTISDYCREDLKKHYPVVADKCRVIYNPVYSDEAEKRKTFPELQEKYDIPADGYF